MKKTVESPEGEVIKKTWQVSNNCYFLRDVSTNKDDIPVGIYMLEMTGLGELYIRKLENKFEFNFKIYGLNRAFIDKFKITYNNTVGNLGALLNGLKGTGKTVTAKILANELEKPVILINHPYNGVNSFLAEIRQDIVVLIDEYEKVYKGNVGDDSYDEDEERVAVGDSSLLALMDGTYSTQFRKVFILTTNRPWLNENMLNRPGRIRYVKPFGDLNLAQITEIIDDCLVHKKLKGDIIDYLKPMKIITVDIVKCVVSEVNIFNQSPLVCCQDFNVEFKDDVYEIVRHARNAKEKDVVLEETIDSRTMSNFTARAKGGWQNAALSLEDMQIRCACAPTNNRYTVYDYYQGDAKKTFEISFNKRRYTHSSFVF